MRILTVSAFLELVNETLKALNDFEPIAVEGEVSQYHVNQGQWVNFDLKDDTSLVSIFMPIWKLKVPLEDGMKVRVHGAGRIYAKYGKFSISAEAVELVGEGALRKALAALRARLEAEGLFDPARKRELPRFPARIALIASTESAAYGDFVRIVRERWPLLKIDSYHVLVQGDRAPDDIVKAIQQANERHENAPYDALVITRGGGSFDELMAFNNERLARTIRGSKIPTLVAIGHERDISIAEDVADVRGSTPTDAARGSSRTRKTLNTNLRQWSNAPRACSTAGWTMRGQRLIACLTLDRAGSHAIAWISTGARQRSHSASNSGASRLRNALSLRFVSSRPLIRHPS